MPGKLLITTDAVGGIWQYTRDLVASLAGNFDRILLCVLGPEPSSRQLNAVCTVAPNVTIEQHAGALEWMPNPWSDVDRASEWLLRRASLFAPDIIHLNSFSYAALSWPAPVVVVAHSCVGTWWRAVHGCDPGPEWSEYITRVRAGLQRADAVVAPSASLAEKLTHFYRLDRTSIEVIHNASSAYLSSISAKEPYCLAAGRLWDEAKNLTLLEQIAASAALPIYIAGEGGAPSSHLHYLGKLSHEEFLNHLSRASLFLHPALYEPFGLVVLEAARLRCPLLLSDIPTMRELWSGCARFLPPREPQAWIDAIASVAVDKAARTALGNAAFEHTSRYKSPAQAQAYLQLYGNLIASRVHSQQVAV